MAVDCLDILIHAVAVRCAFTWVASIISVSGLPPVADSAAKMRLRPRMEIKSDHNVIVEKPATQDQSYGVVNRKL
jgi:hypothetical protein